MQQSGSDFPVWFPLLFIGLWLSIGVFLGFLSGWYALMRRYPDRDERPLATLNRLSAAMGSGLPVSMNGILSLSACPSGLRVRIWRIFGPFNRPFFVPWKDIGIETTTRVFAPRVRLTFGSPEIGRLSVDARNWERLHERAEEVTGNLAMPRPTFQVSNVMLLRGLGFQWAAASVFAAGFFYFAPKFLARDEVGPPLVVCICFPAVVFGASIFGRYMMQRRRG
jgi:hypothetical protein